MSALLQSALTRCKMESQLAKVDMKKCGDLHVDVVNRRGDASDVVRRPTSLQCRDVNTHRPSSTIASARCSAIFDEAIRTGARFNNVHPN